MNRIPLEQRLKAAVTGDSFFLGAFCLLPGIYFYSLVEMTGDDCFSDRYKELKGAFPDYQNKILAEIIYESIEHEIEACIDLLYVILVEPFIDSLFVVDYEVDF